MARRGFVLVVGLLFMAAAAFGGGTNEKGGAGTTIKYMAVAEPISDFIRTEILPAFTKETGINVQIDTTDYVKLHDKEVLELLAGNYDVYQIDQIWVNNYIKNKWVEPLDGLIKSANIAVENYYSTLLSICKDGGVTYALPLSAIPVDYYYNKDMLAQAGLKAPDTWDDVLAIAKKLNNPPNQWGIAIRGERGNPITWTFLPIFWSYGGKIFDEKMKPVYNSPQGVAALTFFKELYQYSAPGWHSAQEIATMMQQGQTGQLTLMSVYNAAMDDASQSKVVGKIEFADMPKGPTGNRASILGMWTIGIGSKSTKKDAAAKFLAYISRPEVAKKLAFSGTVGATMPVIYKDPAAPRFYPVLGRVLNYVQAPPLIAEAEQWFLSFGTALQDALSGAKSPQQALNDSVAEITKVLTDAGYYK
jgi:multiple sugar transport system substrate-binding protein